MSDPYAIRTGGSLKLKSGGDGSKKKKKKSKSQVDQDRVTEVPQESSSKAEGSGEGSSTQPAGDDAQKDNKTDAERRFEEMQKKRRQEKIRKLASTTHKDRVHEFNSKLESLSEHHDIPKVGPG